MAGKRVIALQHGNFLDTRNEVQFHEVPLEHPTEQHDDGSPIRCYMGVAEDLPAEVVREYYRDHPSFYVEGYTPEELGVEPEEEQVAGEIAPEDDTGEGGEPEAGDTEPEDTQEEEQEASGGEGTGEGGEAGESGDEASQEEGGLAGVDFASDTGAELAAEFGLDASAFDGLEPSGKTGFTAADVRKARSQAEGS